MDRALAPDQCALGMRPRRSCHIRPLSESTLARRSRSERLFPGSIEILAQFLGLAARACKVRGAKRNVALTCKDPLTAILVFHFNGLRAHGQSVLAQVFQQSLWFAHESELHKPPVARSNERGAHRTWLRPASLLGPSSLERNGV